MFPPQMVAQPQMQPMSGPPPQPSPVRRRSRMKLAIGGLVVTAGIVVIAIVAGRDKDPAAEGETEYWIIKLEKTRDTICDTCKDEACMRKAMAELDDLHNKIGDHVKPSKEQAKQIHSLVDAIGKCVGATGNGGEEGGGDTDVLSAIENMRVDMCNCMSQSCAEGQATTLNKWMKAHKAAIDALSDDVRSKALAIAKEHKQCYQRLMKDE